MLAVLLALSACVNDPDDVLATAEKVLPTEERGEDVTIYYSDEGQLKMQLKADRVVRHHGLDPFMEFIGNVSVIFYDAALRPNSTLHAGYAIRYEKTQLTEIRDNVEVVNEQGETLHTEELIWDAAGKRIYTEQFVRIRTADEILMGTGLESDQEFRRYRILQPEGTLNIRDHEPLSEDS
jgi:LPS export ABC transporter protein LptC